MSFFFVRAVTRARSSLWLTPPGETLDAHGLAWMDWRDMEATVLHNDGQQRILINHRTMARACLASAPPISRAGCGQRIASPPQSGPGFSVDHTHCALDFRFLSPKMGTHQNREISENIGKYRGISTKYRKLSGHKHKKTGHKHKISGHKHKKT